MSLLESDALPIEHYRQFYAEEIRAVANIKQPALVVAFARVARENFLCPAPWRIAGEGDLNSSDYRVTNDPRDLYHNVLVALKSEMSLNNGQPSALGSWIGALGLGEGMRVYHVGCGAGYYTAIMAEVVGPTGTAIATEIDVELAARAAENLRAYPNVTVVCGDGATVEPGLCDAVLINAGVTHPHVPWLLCLKDGGRLVLPLTVSMAPRLGKGLMVQITRKQDRFAAAILSMVAIYSSTSVRDPQIESLLNKAFESRELLKIKSIRLDSHEETDTCIVHSSPLCLSAEVIGQ